MTRRGEAKKLLWNNICVLSVLTGYFFFVRLKFILNGLTIFFFLNLSFQVKFFFFKEITAIYCLLLRLLYVHNQFFILSFSLGARALLLRCQLFKIILKSIDEGELYQ